MARDAEKATAIMAEHIELTFRSIEALPEELRQGTTA
jgi:hypothetical protein